MSIIDALELIGESAGVRFGTLALKLETDDEVDEWYKRIGPPCAESGGRIADKSSPPRWECTEDGSARWREAVTTVAGVRVILNGPIHVGRRAA